jgi:hypothetical protein
MPALSRASTPFFLAVPQHVGQQRVRVQGNRRDKRVSALGSCSLEMAARLGLCASAAHGMSMIKATTDRLDWINNKNN